MEELLTGAESGERNTERILIAEPSAIYEYHEKDAYDYISMATGKIEKGYGSDAKGFKDSKKIMRKDWQWHSWLRDIENGNLRGSLDVRKISKPYALRLYISGGNPEENEWDKYIFKLDKNNRLSRIDNFPPSGKSYLGNIDKITNEKELARELIKATDNHWLWINIYLYINCRYSKTAKPNWPDILWEEVLRHWSNKVG